jgi:hypothetical protein
LINLVKAIKTLAEYGGGVILSQMKARGVLVAGNPQLYKDDTIRTSVDDLGITRVESSRWQQMAQLPEEEINEIIEEQKQEGKITTNAVIKEVKKRVKSKTPKPKKVEGIRLYHG